MATFEAGGSDADKVAALEVVIRHADNKGRALLRLHQRRMEWSEYKRENQKLRDEKKVVHRRTFQGGQHVSLTSVRLPDNSISTEPADILQHVTTHFTKTNTSTLLPEDDEKWPWEQPAECGPQPDNFVLRPADHNIPTDYRMAS